MLPNRLFSSRFTKEDQELLNQNFLKAIDACDVDKVRWLLQQGANINAKLADGPANQHDVPAFTIATIRRYRHPERARVIMDILQRAGVDLRLETKEQWQALTYATYYKDQWAQDYIYFHQNKRNNNSAWQQLYKIGGQAYNAAYSLFSAPPSSSEEPEAKQIKPATLKKLA